MILICEALTPFTGAVLIGSWSNLVGTNQRQGQNLFSWIDSVAEGFCIVTCCSCSWNISFSAPVELKRQVFECMQVLSLDTGSNCPRPWNNFCTWIFSYPPPMKFKWGVILVVSPCLSVHPSVDEIVSVLLFCIFCNTSWIHFIYTHLISQLQMCHMCNFFLSKIWIFVDFFFFYLMT